MPLAYRVAGLKVLDASTDEAREMLWEDVRDGNAHVYVLVNAYSSTLRRSDSEYAELLEHRDVRPLADGASVAWGSRISMHRHLGRCPGPDLFEASCERAAGDGTPIFLLGGGPGVAELLETELTGRYPGLLVAGTATPPYGEWPDEVSADLIDSVRASGAKIIWLGVSAPKQERWSIKHLDQLGVPIVCVGAAFDFLSGVKPRAPRWIRSLGLEWAFRLASEPSRLWKRYLLGNLVFLWDLVTHRAETIPSAQRAG